MNRDGVTGAQLYDDRFTGFQGSQIMRALTPNPASYAPTTQTYLPTDLLSGIIVRNNAAAMTDTLPTAALMVAAIPRVQVGDILRCLIINGGAGAADTATLTLVAGTGGSWDVNQVTAGRIIRSGSSKEIAIRFTNVTLGSEAYTVYA